MVRPRGGQLGTGQTDRVEPGDQFGRQPQDRGPRWVGVVAAVVATGAEKAAAHRLGLSRSTVKRHLARARSKVWATTTAQLVWILAPRLPEPEGFAQTDE